MSKPKIEINEGEFRVTFDTPFSDNLTLKDLGFEDDQLKVAGGNLRFVIELGHSDTLHFFKVPTIEFTYYEKIGPSTWQVEFNGELMKEKEDPSGHATILLLNRKKLAAHINRHNNVLIIRADFAEEVHLSAGKSYIHLYEHAPELEPK